MIGVLTRRRVSLALAMLLAALAGGVGLTFAQNPNERDVKPEKNPQDRDDVTKPDSKIWALDFRFKDPRLITVDIPGRGRKVCWYVWYQVINHTNKPQTFVPDFELVTHDKDNEPFHDQILPKVEDAIRKVEDPTDSYKIKNSVTIAKEPIPASRPGVDPTPVTGVAIWDDVDPESNQYSIFVGGLSNGWSKDQNGVIRRKTLQLNFKKLGDKYYQDARAIHFIAPASWIYRAVDLDGETPKKDNGKDKKNSATR
jgi:hypothetical protein